MSWWKEMAQQNSKANLNPVYTTLNSFSGKQSSDSQRENAATIIQSHFRRFVKYQNYTRMKNAVSFIQAVIRVRVMMKNTLATTKFNSIKIQEQSYDETKQSKSFSRYLTDRYGLIKLKRSVLIIQCAIRCWIAQKHQTHAAIMIQKCIRGHAARHAYVQHYSAAMIQSCYRSWILRKSFLNHKQATIKIQSHYRGHISRKNFLNKKQAATKIQGHYRGNILRKSFLKKRQAVIKLQRLYQSIQYLRNFKRSKLEIKAAITIQSHTRRWIDRRYKCSIMLIQRYWRAWLMRRKFLLQKDAATRIQSAFRCFKCSKYFNCYKNAATILQKFVKGWIIRTRLLETGGCDHDPTKDCYDVHEVNKLYEYSAVKLQRWWRGILLTQSKKRTTSAILIQSNVRGWIVRKKAAQNKHRIAVIQSHWKGYIERKHSRGKITDIRLRVQKAAAAANVDDGMRIINRLIVALSELKNMKSVSGILHTCATIDMATKHSQKCCEKLVAAGAIDTLLELIRSISRSIADQEVLRHTLSIFRNLTRYPNLTEALIGSSGSGQIILWELIRNKEDDDAYFIAAEVLKSFCLNKNGVERLRNLHALLKRLHNLVEELKRKKCNEKRNQRIPATKDRRLKEAVQILKLITNG